MADFNAREFLPTASYDPNETATQIEKKEHRDPNIIQVPGYEILQELGHGGMGVVYKAKRLSDGRFVALKFMLSALSASFDQLLRFRIESEAIACLNHPNIVKISDISICQGYPYFALEYIEGGSLDRFANAPQLPNWSASVVITIAKAIHFAHERGILHRDLKPANILMTTGGEIRVTDFGLAKFTRPVAEIHKQNCTMGASPDFEDEICRRMQEIMNTSRNRALSDDEQREMRKGVLQVNGRRHFDHLPSNDHFGSIRREYEKSWNLYSDFASRGSSDAGLHGEGPRRQSYLENLTQQGAIMGSPSFMSPEQADGSNSLTPHADVYALGAILYCLLTGHPPFIRHAAKTDTFVND